MSNWTGMRTVHKRGGMAQSVEHIVHIDEGKPPTTAGGGNLVGGFLMRNKRSARLAVASIEHADRWFESNCHHHKPCRITLARFFLCPESAVFDLPPKKVAPS